MSRQIQNGVHDLRILDDADLAAVAAGEKAADPMTLFQMISSIIRSMSEANQAIVRNLG